MSDLLLLLFIGGLIGSVVINAWPILLLIAGVALAGWLFKLLIDAVEDGLDKHRQQESDLIARADAQHRQIMEGNDIAGTYGIYQPPPGLR